MREGGQTTRHDQDRDADEVRGERHLDQHRERTHARADDGAEAEGGVEARHDRAAEPTLDVGTLDVHRDVPDPGAHAVDEEPGAGDPTDSQTPAPSVIPKEAERVQGGADPDDTGRADPVDQRTRRRHGEQRADRQAEQQETEASVVEVQPGAGLGDAGDPAGEGEAVESERERHGVAGREHPAGRGAHSWSRLAAPGGADSSQACSPVSALGLIASSTGPRVVRTATTMCPPYNVNSSLPSGVRCDS